MTQIIGGYAVLLPMSAVFDRRDMSNLLFIPILIHGFGDGLAEPVGIRYGRHKYSVRAFLDRTRGDTPYMFLAGTVSLLVIKSWV